MLPIQKSHFCLPRDVSVLKKGLSRGKVFSLDKYWIQSREYRVWIKIKLLYDTITIPTRDPTELVFMWWLWCDVCSCDLKNCKIVPSHINNSPFLVVHNGFVFRMWQNQVKYLDMAKKKSTVCCWLTLLSQNEMHCRNLVQIVMDRYLQEGTACIKDRCSLQY